MAARASAPASVRFTLPSDRASQLTARLDAALTELGVHTAVAARAVALAAEAIDNSARHAYAGEPGPVTATAGWDGDSLVVTVADSGRGLDLAGAVKSGRGIPRIFAEADEARIDVSRGTYLYLRFRDASNAPAFDEAPREDAAATALLWS
jgi:anti-sigma regulatory factor (Ser/Thr protein kinase)